MNGLKIPKHIGFIVDGNRRWAKQRGLSAYKGHLAGYEAIKQVSRAAFELKVEVVSLYVFSTENWNRSEEEVGKLMGLVLKLLTTDLHIFNDMNIKIKVLGSRDKLSNDVLKAIDVSEAKTADNTAGTLALCFNYGGQLEIVDAVKKIVESKTPVEDITPRLIEQNLYSPEILPIDIVVRTSGEQRISNFMLWRIAYSELMFIDKMWPDMTKVDVRFIIEEYNKRSRRFGG